MSPDDLASRHRSFRSESGYALARTGLFGCALVVVLLIGITGAGTEGQPGLLVSLCIVVGFFVLVSFLVAYAGWRLSVKLDGTRLTVRRLRTKTIDLSQVESVAWQGWIDESIVLTQRSDGSGRRRHVTVPFSTRVLYGIVEIPAWANDEAMLLFRSVFEGLPPDVTFDARAAASFSTAGCRFERAS
ncbi:hypothetical protein BH10ACT3_BH10ACT3_13060 [soil metagenome]